MWHAKEISIVADPPQPINGDGELWGNTPIKIQVIPAAVNVVVAALSIMPHADRIDAGHNPGILPIIGTLIWMR